MRISRSMSSRSGVVASTIAVLPEPTCRFVVAFEYERHGRGLAVFIDGSHRSKIVESVHASLAAKRHEMYGPLVSGFEPYGRRRGGVEMHAEDSGTVEVERSATRSITSFRVNTPRAACVTSSTVLPARAPSSALAEIIETVFRIIDAAFAQHRPSCRAAACRIPAA